MKQIRTQGNKALGIFIGWSWGARKSVHRIQSVGPANIYIRGLHAAKPTNLTLRPHQIIVTGGLNHG